MVARERALPDCPCRLPTRRRRAPTPDPRFRSWGELLDEHSLGAGGQPAAVRSDVPALTMASQRVPIPVVQLDALLERYAG